MGGALSTLGEGLLLAASGTGVEMEGAEGAMAGSFVGSTFVSEAEMESAEDATAGSFFGSTFVLQWIF